MRLTQKGLEEAAQALTKNGCPVLVTSTDIPGMVAVTAFGIEKFMTRMACFWYLYAIHESMKHATDNRPEHKPTN